MKTYFSSKTLIALAVAVAAAAAYETEANEQPIPPPVTAGTGLPQGAVFGGPVAQVIKLLQAGVNAGVIQTYISNCPSAFNLDADKIIALSDVGASDELLNAMFAHDKTFLSALPTVAPAAPAAAPEAGPRAASPVAPPAAPDTAVASAPPAEVTVNYFYDNLAPYGTWVQVDGYGRCWRPNAVVYDAGWRPYCDRGRWVYTDCGWYWNSDYSWGATFHYGRWFSHPNYGWCWWPDTVWAPSWVTWRTCNDYCGWAPLPPCSTYQTGIGFSYHDSHVAVNFGFGLGANCYTFVSYGDFCQPHPRQHCVPEHQVNQVYGQTVVVNNYDCNEHHRIRNHGVSPETIGRAGGRPIQPVPVASLGGSRPRGGAGMLYDRNAGGTLYDRNVGGDINSGRGPRNYSNPDRSSQPPAMQNNNNNNNRGPRPNSERPNGRQPSANPPAPAPDRNVDPFGSGRLSTAPPSTRPARVNENPGGSQRGEVAANRPQITAPPLVVSAPPANHKPAPSPAPDRSPNLARADNSRPSAPPLRVSPVPSPVARPPVRPPPQVVRVAPVPVAPVVSNYRPPVAEPRPTFSQPAPRYVAPAAPSSSPATPAVNSGINRGQGWMAQNR